MKILIGLILWVFFLVNTGTLYAENKSWSDVGELSFIDTGGNTDTTTLSAKNRLTYNFTEKIQANWKMGILLGKSNGDTNAEKYMTELSLNYPLSERLYSSMRAGWLKDRFSGVGVRYNFGPAIGYKFLLGPNHFLVGEAALDYVLDEYINSTEADYLRSRLFAHYDYAITPKNKFTQSLEFLYDFDITDNYNFNSETALTFALNDYLSFKASYELRYDNLPVPITLKKTDTIVSMAFILSFL